jgi:hypothetical protein
MRIWSGRTGWWRAKRKTPVRSSLVFLGLILFAWAIEHWRPTEHASWLIWDGIETALVRPRVANSPRPLYLVVISPGDYERLFNRTSPLESDGVAAIVARALMRKPHRVFVDLETAGVEFSNLPEKIHAQWCELDKACSLPEVFERVIWAQGGAGSQTGIDALHPYLGGNPRGAQSALAFLLPETDGRVRKVSRCLAVGGSTSPTLVGAVAAALARDVETGVSPGVGGQPNCAAETSTERVRPSFQRRLTGLASVDAQTFIGDPSLHAQPRGTAARDEVIVIGGSYSAADRFYTADGLEHPGAFVIAAMAQALASADEVHDHGGGFAVLSAVLIAVLISLASFYLRANLAPVAVFGVFVAGVLLAVFLHVALVNVLALFGVAVGILVHLLAEFQELLDELEHEEHNTGHTNSSPDVSKQHFADVTSDGSDAQPVTH